MAAAWIYQDTKQVKKHGQDRASWFVGWYDPEGKRRTKSCGPGEQGLRNAEKLRRKVEAELLTGTYEGPEKAEWSDFRKHWEREGGLDLEPSSRRVYLDVMNHFERLVNPARIHFITHRHITHYIAQRREERGKQRGSLVSVATINKELRHLRALLVQANEWHYLPEVPKVKMLREPHKLPIYVTPDHFAAIYGACDQARLPDHIPNVSPADWWRALVAFGYMTGWRISEILALRRDDIDLEAGTVLTRFEDNKGKRDALVRLQPVLLDHLRKLLSFGPLVFAWKVCERQLYVEFSRIQAAAGIKLPCRRRSKHQCSPFCHVYGFHDLRRAFATMNHDRLTADALQLLMRHKSYLTTQKYINMAREVDAIAASVYVPEVLQAPRAAQGMEG